jgi:cysteine desulfurase
MIYFDHNATTIIRPEITKTLLNMTKAPYNPSSLHSKGREARKLVENARLQIADALNAKDYDIFFTCSGTESNNWVISAYKHHEIIISSIEHASIIEPANDIGNTHIIPVNHNCVLDLISLKQTLERNRNSRMLVSIMLANNETGAIQPISEITEIAHSYGALVHCDAIQAFGKIKVDIAELRVDMMTISGHKCGGAIGGGALLVKKGKDIQPFIKGGGQEQRKRAGTENIYAIVALGMVASMIEDNLKEFNIINGLRNHIEEQLSDKAIILAKEIERLPNTTCIIMPGVSNQTQLINFDLVGIAVSAGAACSSGRISASHVLTAMGTPEDLAHCAIRVSLGMGNTMQEVEFFIQEWNNMYNKLSKKYE